MHRCHLSGLCFLGVAAFVSPHVSTHKIFSFVHSKTSLDFSLAVNTDTS